MAERDVSRAIERDTVLATTSTRRGFTAGLAATAALAAMPRSASAAEKSLAAAPPTGFKPFSAPGLVVQTKKADTLEANKIYPKAADAKELLTRTLTQLTGKNDLQTAVSQFVHKDDVVVVKVNGIARQNMATAKELVMPFLEAMIAMGIKPENITVLEQYIGFFTATRLNAGNLPNGVRMSIHQNKDATMADRIIPGTRQTTKFVRALTEATACINFSLIKDHSICGYTGALKNMTHGCTINPHHFHAHHASPQIAMLYAQDVIRSRVRLNISDGFRVMADGGPLWKQPQYVKEYGAVLASTDPVALDTIGWEILDENRKSFNIKPLLEAGREPGYIKAAGDLGLGVHERSQIELKTATV